MTLRITSCFAVLLALAAFACSTAPAPSGKTPGQNESKDDDDNEGDDEDDSKAGSDDPKPGESEDLKDYLLPFAIHTGFTGGSEKFRVPLETDLTGTLTWTVEDDSVAEVVATEPPAWYNEWKKEEPDLDLSFAMLTTKKAGKTVVKVSNGTKEHKSDIEVVAYTSAQVAIGQTRYKEGEGDANRRPCAGCHDQGEGPPHNPAWVAELSDDEVLHSVQVGSYEWNNKTYELNNGNHKWNLTDEEKKGILAYLRSIDPDNFNK